MAQSRVAFVTGATRGVGRGIALALAEAGWTVAFTGRTQEGPRSLDQTAQEVQSRGGVPLPLRCEHTDDARVHSVIHDVGRQHHRIDLLVNNVFALPDEPLWERPFWEQPIANWDRMHAVGLRSHYVATVFAMPLLQAAPRPLVVHISSFAGGGYALDVAYGVGKAAVDRMAADMAHQLRSHGVAVVSLWPGVVRTEWVQSLAEPPFPMDVTESPELTGRAVAALADDPDVMAHSGKVRVVAELAEAYGFDDVDGTRPPSLRRRRAP